MHAALDSQVPFLLDFCPRRATKARSLQCSTFHIIYLFNHLSTCHKNHHFTFKTTFLITFRNVIKTIIDNYLLKTSYVYYIVLLHYKLYALFSFSANVNPPNKCVNQNSSRENRCCVCYKLQYKL